MEENKLTGTWLGTVVYGKKYGELSGEKLFFEMEILQNNETISGSAFDIGGAGMSLDPATLLGTFDEKKISFIKRYKTYHYRKGTEAIIDKSKPGLPIYYDGYYNETDKTFQGVWEYRISAKLFWIFPYKYAVGGTWSMQRK